MAKRTNPNPWNPNPWLVMLVAALVGALMLVVAWVAWGMKNRGAWRLGITRAL